MTNRRRLEQLRLSWASRRFSFPDRSPIDFTPEFFRGSLAALNSGDLKIPRVNVLGVGISALNIPLALGAIERAVREKHKGYICVTGVHGVMESQRSAELRRIHNESFLTTPDGMPMVWMGRLRGARQMARVYGPDLMLAVMEASAERGYRHFFYGGTNGLAEELRVKLTERFPGLQVVGTYEPPFRPLNELEERELQAQIATSRPDILWVGISTPKQERFVAEYLPKLDATLMVAVGAAFNFHAGRVQEAPRWVRHSGFQWLYRCAREPRLWKRYGVIVPAFLFSATLQLIGLKKYPSPHAI